ncbi:polyketide synthase, partial [Candidatus Magnetomorum sp. HK-1]
MDTACSSSLTAVHLACQSIYKKECDLALACGVNLILSPELSLSFQKAGMLSPDGRCKTFDKDADGYVRSEGCGVIVLKPLHQAIKDNNNILAVIAGTAINHDGSSNGLTAPNGQSQENLIIKALENADVKPSDISYVETHGTGTILGDPVEIKAIENTYGKDRSKKNPLILGSVKTNIGHTEAAAGIAGLIKTILSIHHGIIPPHLHFQNPNPHISLDAIPAVIPQEKMAWPADKKMAGVSSFGFSGTNAHAIIRNYSRPETKQVDWVPIIVLSAKTHHQLNRYARQLIEFLYFSKDHHSPVLLSDVAYTLQTGRAAMSERLAVLVTDMDDLIEKLDMFCQGETEINQLFYGKADQSANTQILQTDIAEKNWEKLAQSWVLGAKIDWNLLYPGHDKPCAIMLPTYPFEKKRYWISDIIGKPLNEYPKLHSLENSSILYFSESWKSAEITEANVFNETDLLVFAQNDSLLSAFQEKLNTKVIGVFPGDTYARPFEEIFQIQPGSREDYQKMLKNMKKCPQTIVHAWSQDLFQTSQQWVEKQLAISFYSLIHLIQLIGKQYPKDYFQIIYVYYIDPDHSNPVYESIQAFAAAIREENTFIAFKTIGLDDFSHLPSLIDKEIHSEESDIRYISKTRQVRYMKEIACPEPTDLPPIKENGVYLITGGTGKLGLIVAQYLSSQAKVSLVLCGRKVKPDVAQVKTIEQIEKTGTKIMYIQADVTRQKDVQLLINKTKAAFKTIHGIVHCSGVIQYGYLANIKPEDIATVLSSKIFGTLYLDETTKDIALDFYVLFSSIASFIANTGLSCYAYANSFMDHFSHKREQLRQINKRSGKTISINWPMWSDGGMHYEKNAHDVQIFLKNTFGIVEIDTQHATDILGRLLSLEANQTQLMVIPGHAEKIRNTIKKACMDKPLNKQIRSQDNFSMIVEKVNSVLIQMISKILGTSHEDIDIDDDFKDFGFDSITFTNLSNEINSYYQVAITPARFYGVQSIMELSSLLLTERPEIFLAMYSTEDVKINGKKYLSKEEIKETNIIANASSTTPVAIIGISGMFPQSVNVKEFWNHLESNHDLIVEIPSDRKHLYSDAVKWGGFVPNIDKFDAEFFGISPKEATLMDPQQRLCLQTIWNVIEDAGYRASDLSGSQTGIFLGMQGVEYAEVLKKALKDIEPLMATGTAQSIIANRISYLLNFHGPSESIDTACSSSLVAIHRAINAIRNDRCQMAIAGGVNVLLSSRLTVALSQTGVLSDDGRCKTFDKSADGYVRSEGVGALLLKPLDQAEADHDHIYAVIKGSAENHGGRASSLTAPNPKAQADLLITAYQNADIPPDTVTYIEAHGTGTSLGDPVEIDGLKQAFSHLYERSNKSMPTKPHCGIGSVKTSIGHLETAAGVAGVFKVIMSMKHKTLPGNIHFKEVNPYIELENSPFYIVTKQQEWKTLNDKNGNPVPRRSGVSSFGFGGSNAHVVLEEYIDDRADVENSDLKIIVLSAKNKERLYDYATILLDYCSGNSQDISLCDMAYTLQIGRESMEERLAMIVSNIDDLIEKLSQFTQRTKNQASVFTGNPKHLKDRKDILIGGEAGKLFINNIFETKDLDRIAQLWTLGFEIDWQLLYDKTPKRISLPTYPFEKKRYWIQKEIRNKNLPALTGTQTDSEDDQPQLLCIETQWVEKPIALTESPINNRFLVFDNHTDTFKKICPNTVTVISGEHFEHISKTTYCICPDNAQDYQQLFENLDHMPEFIIHLWSDSKYKQDDKIIRNDMSYSLISVFHLTQALLNRKLSNSVLIIYVYPLNHPLYEAISGFARTLSQENSYIQLKTVGIQSPYEKTDHILSECFVKDGLEISYDDTTRLVKQLHPLQPSTISQISLKENGVYLITGGSGQLGQTIAKYIAEQVQSTIVLCGRKAALEKNTLSQLEVYKSDIVYIQSDISVQDDVLALVKSINDSYENITGIIHCAGIINDSLIVNKDIQTVFEVIQPKIWGSIYLDMATKDEPLDFFIFFSSISAVIGNAGQCDYAYSNSFMDAFARYRNQLKDNNQRTGMAVSINWPLWERGGMQIDSEKLKMLADISGILPVPLEQGIVAFETALSACLDQIIILYGNIYKISRVIEQFNQPELKQTSSSTIETIDYQQIIQQIQDHLCNIACNILYIDQKDIDIDDDLADYGFESITFTEFANNINNKFQIEITPARLYGAHTISELSLLLLQEYPDQFQSLYASKDKEHSKIERITIPKLIPQKTIITRQSTTATMPVAIIGMSAIFPQSNNISTFWDHIIAGHDLISKVPKERWDSRIYPIKWGGFIPDVDKFDPQFFGISPKEAELMDPQQRLCLQTIWKTIEDAGYRASDLSGSQTGVFI